MNRQTAQYWLIDNPKNGNPEATRLRLSQGNPKGTDLSPARRVFETGRSEDIKESTLNSSHSSLKCWRWVKFVVE